MSAFLCFELKSTEIPLLCLTLSEQAFTHKQARENDAPPFFPFSFPQIYPSGQGKKQLLWHFYTLYLKEKFLNPSPVSFQKAFIRHNVKRKLVGNCWNGLRSLVVNVVTRGKLVVITVWSEINACRGSYQIGSY